MIPIEKLAKLSPRHRMRKAAIVLTELERQLLGASQEPGAEAAAPGAPAQAAAAYAARLASLFAAEEAAPETVREAARLLGSGIPDGARLVRAVDALRHALLAATGQAPADWDLIDPSTGRPDSLARRVSPGIRAYLEDLRSPFNVGTIFRSSDAFGVEELILSPLAAEPSHPRALRSAMGAVDLVPWRRADLEELDGEEGVFALELGGEPIGSFRFPRRGIVLIGSEELGVSAEALSKCTHGRVSIPMAGAKASLNVAVAFGILMHAWRKALDI